MKIRMVEERTGPRHDGRYWAPVGGEMYIDDEEGAAVCAAGWAIPLPDDTPVELRGSEKPSEAPEKDVPAKGGGKTAKAPTRARGASQG